MMFSVVIPTYNRVHLLSRALDSLWRQSYTDFEVIVVDDGSTDGTLSYLATLDGRVRVLTQTNCGPGAARNLGARNARGDYLAFLDSDDLWFPWALATFAEVIERYEGPDFVSSTHRPFVSDAELEQVSREPLSVEVFNNYYEAPCACDFAGANIIVGRRVFEAVQGFTPQQIYGEDCDLALRLGLAKGFVQILAPVTLGYRQHSASTRQDHRLILEGVRNLIESERKGVYPGGPARRLERLQFITLHTRPASISSIQESRQRQGWRLYWETFGWHVRIARWKYLLGFPLMALACALGFRPTSQQ
jgi:glycosyltransferase involved in cell wall biosynthesis